MWLGLRLWIGDWRFGLADGIYLDLGFSDGSLGFGNLGLVDEGYILEKEEGGGG